MTRIAQVQQLLMAHRRNNKISDFILARLIMGVAEPGDLEMTPSLLIALAAIGQWGKPVSRFSLSSAMKRTGPQVHLEVTNNLLLLRHMGYIDVYGFGGHEITITEKGKDYLQSAIPTAK